MDLESFKKSYNYNLATQVIKQYLDIKFLHLDCLLLFRMGDFYELFYEDAVIASKILGIALTKRGKTGEEEIPMCGVPFHALENYLNKLIEENYKIAICDQLETPEDAKKRGGYKAVVNREVVRIITPGTVTEESLITSNLPNYLASLVINKCRAAICYIDLGTTELNIVEVDFDDVINQLSFILPKEILISEKLRGSYIIDKINKQIQTRISYQVDSFFASNKCEKIILEFYQIVSLQTIGELSIPKIASLGSILEYVNLTQKIARPKFGFPKIINHNNFMNIDPSTRVNLEITQSQSNKKAGSLLDVIDRTITKSGSRLLYKMLCTPLTDIDEINSRLDLCEFFYHNNFLAENIRKLLPKISDLERIITRLNIKRGGPRDLLSIKYALETSLKIKKILVDQFGLNLPSNIKSLSANLSGDEELLNLIEESILEDSPVTITEGKFIKHKFHIKIKELYDYLYNGNQHIESLKRSYQIETGIDTLKIQHNNVLGLFIEITPKYVNKMIGKVETVDIDISTRQAKTNNINNDKSLDVNSKFIHRQNTANAVRYTTVELQQLESKIVNAKTQVISLEKELFTQICDEVLIKSDFLKELAHCLSMIDVFSSLGYLAVEYNYCRPELKEDSSFEVKNGRHPVIEQILKIGHKSFTSNDCCLSKDERIWLITGPNMAGKSTFLKQNALIAILAQIGSFVPASSAKIGIIDKIYSRIGAGDNLLKGESTFMVEMLETAAILAQSTSKSLIILDEVGRGTSTYDGVAIAWAVLEYIHDKLRSRCLFATHYFELINLSNFLPALKNYTVAIEEINDKILFLYKIIVGSADKSYGVHVAKLAGLPNSVINRANEILEKFEKTSINIGKKISKTETNNLSLF